MKYLITRSMAVSYVVNSPYSYVGPESQMEISDYCFENLRVFLFNVNSTEAQAAFRCQTMFEIKENLLANKNFMRMAQHVASTG